MQVNLMYSFQNRIKVTKDKQLFFSFIMVNFNANSSNFLFFNRNVSIVQIRRKVFTL
jgi:hypothetical protein